MSAQPGSIALNQADRWNRFALVRAHGLGRDLPLVLFAEVSIAAGAFAAYVLQGSVAQAMTAIGSLSVASLALTLWFAILYRSDLRCQGFLALQAAWGYWYLIPMFLAAVRGHFYLDGEVRYFTASRILSGCLAMLIAKCVSTFVYQLMLARPVIDTERISSWFNRRSYRAPMWAVGLQFAAGAIPFLFSGTSFFTAILRSRSAGGIFPTSNYNPGGGLFTLTFLLASCSLLGFYRSFLNRKKSAKAIFLTVALAALAISAIAISTRTMLLASVMPMLTLYLLGNPDRWRVVKVSVCLVLMWVSADILVSARQKGFLDRNGAQQKLSRNLVDNDFYTELLYVMEVVPDQVHFSYASPIGYALVTVIPRGLWPGKPVPESGERVMRLRINYLSGELGGNVLPGLIGQYWEAAGWLGVMIAGIWLGAVVALLDRILKASNWHIRYLVLAFVWAVFISFRTFAISNLLPAIICASTVLIFSRSQTPLAYGRISVLFDGGTERRASASGKKSLGRI